MAGWLPTPARTTLLPPGAADAAGGGTTWEDHSSSPPLRVRIAIAGVAASTRRQLPPAVHLREIPGVVAIALVARLRSPERPHAEDPVQVPRGGNAGPSLAPAGCCTAATMATSAAAVPEADSSVPTGATPTRGTARTRSRGDERATPRSTPGTSNAGGSRRRHSWRRSGRGVRALESLPGRGAPAPRLDSTTARVPLRRSLALRLASRTALSPRGTPRRPPPRLWSRRGCRGSTSPLPTAGMMDLTGSTLRGTWT
mmetsp:Transcript_61907/g.182863  ORF Transcript_61907/g.182863 Transcript_61907/m.182863 type:complete len:256 (-) Transcript_61907:1869-2636(-)